MLLRIRILKLTHNLEFGFFRYAALTANLSCDDLNIFVKFHFLFEIKREPIKKSWDVLGKKKRKNFLANPSDFAKWLINPSDFGQA